MNIPPWNISQVLGAIIGGLLGLIIGLLMVALLSFLGPVLLHIVSFGIGGAAIGWFIARDSKRNDFIFSWAFVGLVAGLISVYLSLASLGDFTLPVPFIVLGGMVMISMWIGGQFGAGLGEQLGWTFPAITINKPKVIWLQTVLGFTGLGIFFVSMWYLSKPKLLNPEPCTWTDGIIKRTGCLAIIEVDNQGMCRFELAPSGDIIAATGLNSNRVKLWGGENAKLLSTIESTNCNDDVAFASSAQGAVMAVRGANGQVGLWRAEDGGLLHKFQTDSCSSPTCRLALSPDGELLATVDFMDGRLWQVRNGTLLHALWDRTAPIDIVESVTFSPDGESLALGTNSGKVHFWRTDEGTPLNTTLIVPDSNESIEALAYSPDSRLLASRTREGSIQLWEVNTASMIYALASDSPLIGNPVFSKDGTLVAALTEEGTVYLWNISDGSLARTHRMPQRPMRSSLASTPDGLIVAFSYVDFHSGKRETDLWLWQVEK